MVKWEKTTIFERKEIRKTVWVLELCSYEENRLTMLVRLLWTRQAVKLYGYRV
jgi:hypothetical protein